MKIAVAQTIVKKGDIATNIEVHLKQIETALKNEVDLILFPELSLTGYEPELAAGLAIELDDRRLEVFKDLSRTNKLVIVVGAPIRSEGKPYIGSIIFTPGGATQLYIKRYLHTDEDAFFNSRPSLDQIDFMGKKINFAICADITNPQHPKDAAIAGCNIYLASVLISKKKIAYECGLLKTYAKDYGMTVFMSNYGGESGGYISGGNSGAWSNEGEVIAQLEHAEGGLLIASEKDGNWS